MSLTVQTRSVTHEREWGFREVLGGRAADRTADEPFRKKALRGSLRADNNSHKPESRNSKTISILMAGSSVNPFIGVGQICISSSASMAVRARPKERGRRIGTRVSEKTFGGNTVVVCTRIDYSGKWLAGRWQCVKSPAPTPSAYSQDRN